VANDRNRSHDMLLASARRWFPDALGLVIDQSPTLDQVYELEGRVKNSDLVIFMLAAVRSGEAAVGQEAPVLGALAKAASHGKPVLAILMGAPYVAAQLPETVGAVVCAFGIGPHTLEAAVDLALGRIPSIGRLPVHINKQMPRGFQVAVAPAKPE